MNNASTNTSKKSLSIRWRFIVLILVVLVVVFGSLTAVLINNSTRTLRKNLEDRSIAFSELATEPIGDTFMVYKDSGTIRIDQQVRNFLQLNDDVIRISIINLDGETQYQLNARTDQEFSDLLPNARDFNSNLVYDNDLIVITVPYFEKNQSHSYSIVYQVSVRAVDSAIRSEAITLILFSVVGLFVSSFLSYVFVDRYFLNPVANVSEQARAISNGDLDRQIVTKNNDEIGSLAESVNLMARGLKEDIEKLQEMDKVKTEFMMIISHNLSTPLAVINGYLETAELLTTKEQFEAAIKSIADSARRLGVFAEDVFAISSVELGMKMAGRHAIKCGDFFNSLVIEMKASAQLKKRNFSYENNISNEEMFVNRSSIRSAIFNIFENSLKFTPEDGEISFSVNRDSSNIIVTIRDTGIGISEEEMPKLFTKFHRGTSTMTYDYEGIGMGLYASKVMVESNDGTISASSVLGEGSTFTITIPFQKAELDELDGIAV